MPWLHALCKSARLALDQLPAQCRKPHLYEERQMFFTPGVSCSSASFVQCPLGRGCTNGLQVGSSCARCVSRRMRAEQKKVQRRAIKSCRTPRLGGKRCLASRRGDGEQPSDRCRAAIGRGWWRVTSRHVYLGCSKGDLSVVVRKSSQVFCG